MIKNLLIAFAFALMLINPSLSIAAESPVDVQEVFVGSETMDGDTLKYPRGEHGNIFPKIINKKWIKKNQTNQKIGLEGIQIFSKAILESWNHGGNDNEITFSDYLLSNGNIKNKKILKLYWYSLFQHLLLLK